MSEEQQHRHPNSPIREKRYYEPTQTVAFKVTQTELQEIKAALSYRRDSGYLNNPSYRDLFVPLFFACLRDPDSEDVFDLNQTG